MKKPKKYKLPKNLTIKGKKQIQWADFPRKLIIEYPTQFEIRCTVV